MLQSVVKVYSQFSKFSAIFTFPDGYEKSISPQ